MTRHEDTPERRAEMIAATRGLADQYPACEIAVAVMEDPSMTDLWEFAVHTGEASVERTAQVLTDVLRVAVIERPDATLAKAALEQMDEPDFVRYVADRLVR